ncbi:uncharacterized protein FOMMEDRAFT_32069 [Fomitiporia mediterranea MF3/22]|uniref:uncharacterized protein n=1 Tax=Fomitiporia mediterranea (strain MF3/22) TaxID=694068 RepID=UPI0004409080|nr:uncharacterized protein FOMMEDRAFT_32069 [Fomitiporia mediterranea MF3/22]EJC97818.1 hypothetical protein FOMMEDRAFT_32069 [Fomitiporia mediterranea MF3/22]
MPRKPLPNENADARRNGDSKLNYHALSKDKLGKKKILLGNSQDTTAARERFFAREIKNLARSARQLGNAGAVDPLQDLFLGKAEPDRLNQLTTDFGSFNMRDEGGTSTVAQPGSKAFEPAAIFSLASSFLSLQHSRSNPIVYNINKRRRGSTPGNGSEHSSQISSSGSNQHFYRRHRYSSNVFNTTKRSSFRSTSIASQSTPLPRQSAPRIIRPFRSLDDESELHFRFDADDASVGCKCETGEPETQLGGETVSKADNQVPENQDNESADADVMTQLASQLSEVVLSPCITPVKDDLLQFPEVSDKGDSRTRACRTRIKGRATSFSLGFIPEAFPEEIDDKDLRIVI